MPWGVLCDVPLLRLRAETAWGKASLSGRACLRPGTGHWSNGSGGAALTPGQSFPSSCPRGGIMVATLETLETLFWPGATTALRRNSRGGR
jgi:hypothetical protein